MCYAIPGKVEEIYSDYVVVSYFGEKKKARNEFDDIQIGDYIYAQGGYVIETIPKDIAIDILELWKETFFELQEVDLRLSKIELENKNYDKRLLRILDKVLERKTLNHEDLLYLINQEDEESLSFIYKVANFLRRKYLGNSCCVHGILEFSNICKNSCRYCGINFTNNKINRYTISFDEILKITEFAIEKVGFKALVLQSGENPDISIDYICEIIKEIKRRYPSLIFISIGEIGLENLEKCYNAGARGILLRFETSNPELYEQIKPGKKLKTRIEHLKEAYNIGYLIITGSIIGIPGQTKEDIINDILLTKELKAEMYSFGPFVPHYNTEFSNCKSCQSNDILKTIALSRLVDPENAKILVTTAFETIDNQARKKGLMAGANSLMINITPFNYKKDYEIYPNRACIYKTLEEQVSETISLLRNLGRAPTDLGF